MNLNSKSWRWFLPATACFSVAIYLFVSSKGYGMGYPLDDAWIHLTYARNLVDFGQWMFLPGIVSGGSTSPLWTVLLTPIYLLNINPLIWTTLLGFIFLTFLGFLIYVFIKQQTEDVSLWWIAGIIAVEWHFVWAALSGMETLLQTAANLAVAVLLFRAVNNIKSGNAEWLFLGLMIGGMVWIRPDAVTWLGPAGLLAVYVVFQHSKKRWITWAYLIFGFIIPFTMYLVFNHVVSESIWPNTMYAKQAEYQAYQTVPYISRYLRLFVLPFIGSSVLLIPGLINKAIQSIRKHDLFIISLFLWWLGMVGVYAAKLPVTYQHGRYMIPVMIMPAILGICGTFDLANQLKLNIVKKQRFVFAGKALFVGLQLAFLVLGANAYRDDIGVIETEMVDTALWVQENIPEDAVLAVHDIGAMGYYGGHEFIDLAGLVNPEVIPFIRDDQRLAEFLDENDVDFVIVFPSWYSALVEGKEIFYSTEAELSPSMGGENMSIYCWKKCK
ncbi:MAG: hypothetical protein JEZ00_21565 [Anaerolineaceae bacterium]|nr:hypothetical protein [Anaerolineaceae bacterium]